MSEVFLFCFLTMLPRATSVLAWIVSKSFTWKSIWDIRTSDRQVGELHRWKALVWILGLMMRIVRFCIRTFYPHGILCKKDIVDLTAISVSLLNFHIEMYWERCRLLLSLVVYFACFLHNFYVLVMNLQHTLPHQSWFPKYHHHKMFQKYGAFLFLVE